MNDESYKIAASVSANAEAKVEAPINDSLKLSNS
jgi:hypothetical protein